jgi:triosephosphate isomerase
MLPRPLCAGNWKMNGLRADLAEIAQIARAAARTPEVEVLICPPATLLAAAVQAAQGHIGIGGQDCHGAVQGPHTGEISAAMLADAGASHVLVGHSERRRTVDASDVAVAAKLAAAQAAGLTAVLCVGETLAQRQQGQATAQTVAQMLASLPTDARPAQLVLAYEPVWAIGTGLLPKPHEISIMHAELRQGLRARFGPAGGQVAILYGGSVAPETADATLAADGVDGALVGGASLRAASFVPILHALARRAHPA